MTFLALVGLALLLINPFEYARFQAHSNTRDFGALSVIANDPSYLEYARFQALSVIATTLRIFRE